MATKKYKLLPGYTFTVRGGEPEGKGMVELKGGDTVELREDEAAPILYMFESAKKSPAVAEKSLEEALGEDLAAKLHEAGIHSLTDVRDAGADLGRLPGISPAEAKKAREAAK